MENKGIKVDCFEIYENPYDIIDRVSHGLERYYAGHCLLEDKNELYLADTLEEIISTDEGTSYSISGASKFSCVGEITDELDISWIDEGNIDIDYLYIDDIHKISEDGQLLDNEDKELRKMVSELVSISITSENEIMEGCNTISKNTIPYGKINASIELSNGEVILHMGNDRSFILSDKSKEKTLRAPLMNDEKKKELLDILAKQQEKIESQEKELADLKEQRRSLNEK